MYWAADRVMSDNFPPGDRALADPDGLLAIGGDLSVDRLLDAYRRGIFPWYSEGQPILWWSPATRSLIEPRQLHISRSLRKLIRQQRFELSWDRDFEGVIDGCAEPRQAQNGTWITGDMRNAYVRMFNRGFAHSVECALDGKLVGGIYGITLGRAFFGESMFSRASNASKVAMAFLCQQLVAWDFDFLDCQVHNPHLQRMGAQICPRTDFERRLVQALARQPSASAWCKQS